MDKIKSPFSGNMLKIMALIFMTIDHIGYYLLPGVRILRIIGRLAMPIFAYMIAEGCTYTKKPKKYFLSVFSVGLFCQLVYLIAIQSLSMCIFITFSFSIILIFSLKFAEEKGGFYFLIPLFALSAAFFISYVLPRMFPHSGFHLDYGFYGVVLPLFAYIPKERHEKLFMFAIGVLLLSLSYNTIQFWSLLSIPLLILYNGKRGKLRIKYLFYAYYPLHLAVLYVIKELIR